MLTHVDTSAFDGIIYEIDMPIIVSDLIAFIEVYQ